MKADDISAQCEYCGDHFKKPGSTKARLRKYCSRSCASNSWRNNVLCEKPCIVCGKMFKIESLGNRRRTTCSHDCLKECRRRSGSRQEHPSVYSLTKEQIEYAILNTSSYIECAEYLNVPVWTMYRKMKKFGIKRIKKNPKPRIDGYISYTTPQNHRSVYESFYGVKLDRKTIVHHLDGNRSNNAIENLVAVSNEQHSFAHSSLDAIGYNLFRCGMVVFNKKDMIYEPSSELKNFLSKNQKEKP